MVHHTLIVSIPDAQSGIISPLYRFDTDSTFSWTCFSKTIAAFIIYYIDLGGKLFTQLYPVWFRHIIPIDTGWREHLYYIKFYCV